MGRDQNLWSDLFGLLGFLNHNEITLGTFENAKSVNELNLAFVADNEDVDCRTRSSAYKWGAARGINVMSWRSVPSCRSTVSGGHGNVVGWLP